MVEGIFFFTGIFGVEVGVGFIFFGSLGFIEVKRSRRLSKMLLKYLGVSGLVWRKDWGFELEIGVLWLVFFFFGCLMLDLLRFGFSFEKS